MNINKKQLIELIKSDDLSDMMEGLDDLEIEGQEEVWRRINAGISGNRKRKRIALFSKIVASIVLFIGLSYSFLNNFKDNNFIVVETAELERPQEVLLPDGTVVMLNSYSSLVYPKEFALDSREVEFEGLGYFSVTKDKNRPFTIVAPESEVKVLGTSFSVRAYEGEANEEIYLEEGSVALSYKKEEVLLVPGELATVNTSLKSISKNVNLNKNINAWKTRELVFDNDPLYYVFSELEKYYGRAIVVDNQEILNLRFKGHYTEASIEEILQVLTYTLHLDYTTNDKNILLTNK